MDVRFRPLGDARCEVAVRHAAPATDYEPRIGAPARAIAVKCSSCSEMTMDQTRHLCAYDLASAFKAAGA